MSLIAVPPVTAYESAIDCGDFLPAIVPADARLRMRIDGTVSTERLRSALIEAAGTVADELDAWVEARVIEGYATLGEVPARTVDGESLLVQRYHRAVRCLASAELIERMRDYDTTNEGHQQADKLIATIEDLRRDARWAISDIVGRTRSTVELI